MAGVKPEEAEQFYEEDEDPTRVFALFDAGQEVRTTRPIQTGPAHVSGRLRVVRRRIAMVLRRAADRVEPPQVAPTGERRAVRKSS